MCKLNGNFDWEQFFLPSDEGFYLFGSRYKFFDPDLGLEKLLYYVSDELNTLEPTLDENANLKEKLSEANLEISKLKRQLERIRDLTL